MMRTIGMADYLRARNRRLAEEEWEAARGRGVYGDTALVWGGAVFFAAWLLRGLLGLW